MQISFPPTQPGVFLARLNRFVALVETGGREVQAHIATSGRLGELLVPGAALYLEASSSAVRRTAYSIRTVFHEGIWVSIDAHLPNRLIKEALIHDMLQPFAGCAFIRSEPLHKDGRFDFLLSDAGQAVFLEVKSVTLNEQGIALFPDAPTERGRRHLQHLTQLRQEGCRCGIVFVVQRPDADFMAPNSRTDRDFSQTLRTAVAAGVEAYAYRCGVSPQALVLQGRLPVLV